jgi:WD40 repeat protein/DNA-binding SARP family transcriptional activator
MGIAFLGPLTVNDGAVRLGARDRVVLAALAMRPGEVLSAAQLAEAVWRGAPPASWRKNLQSCVVRLRKALGQYSVETSPHGYRLASSADEVDGPRFERLVGRGRELLILNESERAAYMLGQAVGLWRGRALVELEEWEPGIIEARRLDELRLEAQELWLEAALASGHHREVLADAQAMAGAEPLRERRWQLLALAQYQSGRQGEALRTIQHVRRVLVEELGVDPGPELDAIQQAILRQDPALVVETALTSSSDRCPYLGLTPYDVGDSEGFFGRDRDVTACLDRLRREGVLVVVGPSGCGKSSLVRAGLAAALRREGGEVAVINPGADPVNAFATVLPWRKPTVLVVDQGEEVFSLCQDATERDAFLNRLAEHVETAPVVIAMRADRMGDISVHPGLARMVERSIYVLAAMPADDLRAAVEGPARQAGLMVEPGLVDLLVREVEGEPGALPLLSHALRETWLRREGRTLTVAGYQATGGIRGAVAQSAEDVYGGIEPGRRPVLRDLLLRLVSPGVAGEPVRARVPRRLVVADSTQDELIDLLVGSRLVTSDDGVVELAHEALARAWPRLRGWLEDDVEGQRILHHLTTAADAWDSLGRPESELYRGLRLVQAMEWRQRPHPELTATECDFLDASQRHAEMEERAAADRARHQALLIKQLRAALAGARALATEDIDESIASALVGVQLDDSSASRTNLLAVLAKRPQLIGSIKYDGTAIRALDVSPDGRTLAVYDHHGRVQLYDRRTWEVLGTYEPAHTRESRELVGPLAFSPDGRTLAVGMPLLSPDPVRLLDAATLKPIDVRLPGLPAQRSNTSDRALGVRYSADGRCLAATFHHLQQQPSSPTVAGVPQWRVVASSVLVWNVAGPGPPTLRLRKELPARTTMRRDCNLAALSPDGQRVYTSVPLTAYEVESRRTLFATSRPGYVIDVSPDGQTIAIDDGPDVLLIDALTGDLRRILRGHREEVVALRFSTAGTLLVSSATDHLAIVWDAETGQSRERLQLGESIVQGLAFSPDDDTLYTAGNRGAIRTWDLEGRRRYLSRLLPPGEFGFGWVNPAPGRALAAHWIVDHGMKFLDIATARTTPFVRPPGEYQEPDGFTDGAWHPSDNRFVTAYGGLIQTWDPHTAKMLGDNHQHQLTCDITDLDYTRDGSRIVVGSAEGHVIMLDANTLEPVGKPVFLGEYTMSTSAGPDNRTAFVLVGGVPDPASYSFEFADSMNGWAMVDLDAGVVLRREEPGIDLSWGSLSPDGRHAAIGGFNGEVLLVNTRTGELVRPTVVAHTQTISHVAWTPDGSRFITSAYDGRVNLWDGASGELMGSVVVPEESPAAAQFLADGHTVFIVSYTDSAYLWDTRPEHAIAFAARLTVRNLTEAELHDQFGAT